MYISKEWWRLLHNERGKKVMKSILETQCGKYSETLEGT